MAGRSLTRVQGGVTDTIHINTDKFAGVRTMSRSDGSTISVDRTADSGGRTMTVTVDELPLTDATTSIKVTVAGHSDLDGIYTGSAGADGTWSQQGGNGQISTSGYNSEIESQDWFVIDTSDYDPDNGDAVTTWYGGEGADRPWKANLPSSHAVKITGIAGTETITVDRSSDRKGESRPLLSKVVGGAAAAYSLRDLNDKAGNNKVVEVFRSSDDTSRVFLAKEISNGTLEAWVGAGNDGTVSKWYDQSGNERHAEQGASANQPKIVDSGVLKKDTDGNPYLHFDGSHYFRIYKNSSLSEGLILPDLQDSFSVCVFSHTTNSSKLLAQLNRSGDRYYLYNRKIIFGDNKTLLDSASQNTKHVRSVTASAEGVFTSYLDSVIVGSNTYTGTVNGGDSSIGATNVGGAAFLGDIYELVVYRTAQSANRPAIEANINNQYDIY